ncbi:MAG: MlaD family protein [Alkalilacustris sp.]
METRANYVLIGAFALAGFLGLIGFFLWFARVELDRQFAYYDVRFPSVSGLARASEVRFAGLPVGQVVDVRLSPDDDRVVVRLEVTADTPIRSGSIATIESQGVTGVSFVGITPGERGEPLLIDTTDGVPEIESGRSVLQSLAEDAPEVVSEALEVMRQLSAIFSAENQERVTSILDNLERSSGDLSDALDAFAGVTTIIGDASTEIASFTRELEPLVTPFANALETLDTVLVEVGDLAARVSDTLDLGDDLIVAAASALQTVERLATDEVPPTLEELRETAASVRTQLDRLGDEAEEMMAEFTLTGRAATARLDQAEDTLRRADALIERLDETLATVERTAASADALISGDGAALAAAATRLAEDDVPRALADLRAAAASARMTADDVSGLVTLEAPRLFDDLRATSGAVRREVDSLGTEARTLMATYTETGAAATARLTEAEETIAAVNAALARVDGTLDSLERTASSVEGLVATDGAALVADTRALIDSANTAMVSVMRIADTDLPTIIADVRAATGTAARVAEQVGADLTAATGRIEGLSDTAAVAVEEAGQTFARARVTLDALDAALSTSNRTLDAAERAFDGAARVLDEDVAPITADLRAMIAQLEATFATVAEDFPQITADLRRASASADDAFAELEAMARDARGPVSAFATTALPQFSQLAREARGLVTSFDRLVRQLERDPSRVLFRSPPPEFRR